MSYNIFITTYVIITFCTNKNCWRYTWTILWFN